MSVADQIKVLKDAKHLLRTSDRWIQQHYATNEDGIPVSDYSDEAKCFCLVGAVSKAADNHNFQYLFSQSLCAEIMKSVRLVKVWFTPAAELIRWNDGANRKYSEVIEALDITIKRLSKK